MMKTTALIAVLGLSHHAYAHYCFSQLIVNGSETPDWYYVRDVLPDPRYPDDPIDLSKMSPFYDISSSDIICGRDAGAGPKTHTATILAGSELSFKVYNWTIGSAIFHPGPGQVYLSKVPDSLDVENYDGSEGWFKIASAGAKNDTTWLLLWEKEMKFTIPKTTPPGKYLMRIEHLSPHQKVNKTQWYVNCAHINVVGPGGGTPTGLVRFPGAYNVTDPGILLAPGTSNKEGLLRYVAPGPAVWTG